ncbi:SH3 domain-containing protein [Streptomyces sp. SS]|uniref:SH3 domain-containing protein n=1 Tax=Streptomyces sp. SS TaxID=260742 RepID=UPI000FFB06DF|nr:SH3 domain-containing protein [Streptomyces sp. SS]
MHRLMISGAAVAALLAGAASPAIATTPATPSTTAPVRAVAELNSCGYDVAGSNVNLRSGAGTRHASLGHLTRGDLVDVDRKSGGWYRVTLSERSRSGIRAGTVGWVAERYLKPSVCTRLD